MGEAMSAPMSGPSKDEDISKVTGIDRGLEPIFRNQGINTVGQLDHEILRRMGTTKSATQALIDMGVPPMNAGRIADGRAEAYKRNPFQK